MAIEIVGDADAIKVLNPTAEKTNAHERQNARSGSHLRFHSVAIPDISNQNFLTTVPVQQPTVENEIEAEIEADSETVNEPTTTVTSLNAIKNSIERSFDGQSDSDLALNLIEELDGQSLTKSNSDTAPESDTDMVSDTDMASDTVTGTGTDIASATTRPRGLRSPEQCPFSNLESNRTQIQPVVEAIIEKYPTGTSSVIAFSSTERNEQLEPTIMSVAVTLQNKTPCKILIIDGDLCSPLLTENMSCETAFGLADIAKGGNTLDQLLKTTSIAGIEFLPAGQSAVANKEKLNAILKKTMASVANQFDYVLVSMGDAHEEIAEAWSSYTSGTFLLVSIDQTNRDIAKSAVAQLTNFGARLIGSIVTDFENEY